MVVANADEHTAHTRARAQTLETVLLTLGALDDYEAIAQAIADGACQLVGTPLVTLTVPMLDGAGTIVVASGGVTPASPDAPGADALPMRIFSLASERTDDGMLPLLRLHGDSPISEDTDLAILRQFAPHARLALERARRFAALMHLAYSDPLTGLANMRGLQAELEREAASASMAGGQLALLLIDLDDFRRYNSVWGHLVGDAALQYFARAIRSATRPGDFVARVGGEEFAMLLPGSGEAEARIVAARIHEAIATGSGGLPSPFTASIGVGVYPNDVPNALSLYAVADTAMTMAKKAGKNQTFHFEAIAEPTRSVDGSSATESARF